MTRVRTYSYVTKGISSVHLRPVSTNLSIDFVVHRFTAIDFVCLNACLFFCLKTLISERSGLN